MSLGQRWACIGIGAAVLAGAWTVVKMIRGDQASPYATAPLVIPSYVRAGGPNPLAGGYPRASTDNVFQAGLSLGVG